MNSIESYANIEPITTKPIPKTVFIWLDILGFADALEDESRFSELAQMLNSFQSLFDSIDGCHTTIISDGLLLRIVNSRVDALQETFQLIGEKQIQFILEHKIFIRGGIALGSKLEDTSDDNNNLISQGLARAAKLEASSIDWPVIATNEKNIKEIQDYFRAEDELFSLNPCFNRKGEKIFFIDFLNEPITSYYNILNEKINEYEKTPSVHSKYIWLLRHYHHKFSSTLRNENRCQDEIW
ncbi:MAG: hypothetical protein COA92_07100 [Sulfurovum sp.]|nr:MAG: hypothetical protein COA92_07100 [Sulfurovum sp.]